MVLQKTKKDWRAGGELLEAEHGPADYVDMLSTYLLNLHVHILEPKFSDVR